ncbi:acyl-CoA dehydrogenase, partial [Mycobacterium sp. ITM-2017-0098]
AVLGAPDADLLVLVAGEDVVIVDATAHGVAITRLESLDTTRSTRSAGTDTLVNVTDPMLRGAARNARTVFRTLAAAEAVGVSWAVLDMAVEYAKVREQFG